MRQDGDNGGRHVVHLVNYHAQRRATGHVEALAEPVPLRDMHLAVRRPGNTGRVFLAGSGDELPVSVQNGAATCHRAARGRPRRGRIRVTPGSGALRHHNGERPGHRPLAVFMNEWNEHAAR
jgi:hypothetical protein